MNKAFSEYARRVGFNVTLTHPQIRTLMCIHQKRWCDRPNTLVMHVKALQNKGLINHHSYPDWQDTSVGQYTCLDGARPAYTLTRAGYYVAKLLEIAEAGK